MCKAYILTVNSLLKYLLGSSSIKVTKTNDIHIISSYKLVLHNISITHCPILSQHVCNPIYSIFSADICNNKLSVGKYYYLSPKKNVVCMTCL